MGEVGFGNVGAWCETMGGCGVGREGGAGESRMNDGREEDGGTRR